MKAIFCSFFFLLSANEIVVDLTKSDSDVLPLMPPDLEFTIAGAVYPVDLNHNRKFTEEERCLLEAVMDKIQETETSNTKCQWLNTSLEEIKKCGNAQLADQMAHNTLEELLRVCARPRFDGPTIVLKYKSCNMAAMFYHIYSLLRDDLSCKRTGVCQRCQVLQKTLKNKPFACHKMQQHRFMLDEVKRRYTANCPNKPLDPTSAPANLSSTSPFAILADPDFNNPLSEKNKCIAKAQLQLLKDKLGGVSECSRMENFTEQMIKCGDSLYSHEFKDQLAIVCAQQELLPRKVWSEGEKCSLNAKINYQQSLLDEGNRCSALEKQKNELKKCPTAIYAQYTLPYINFQLTANCPEGGKEQEGSVSPSSPTNSAFTESSISGSSTYRPSTIESSSILPPSSTGSSFSSQPSSSTWPSSSPVSSTSGSSSAEPSNLTSNDSFSTSESNEPTLDSSTSPSFLTTLE